MASQRTERLLGEDFRKIQPKLRMFAKGKDDVNFVRADFASAMRVTPAVEANIAEPVASDESRVAGKVAKKDLVTRKMTSISDTVEVNVFVSSFSSVDGASDGRRALAAASGNRMDSLETATLRLNDLPDIAEIASVAHIELGEALKRPDAVVSNAAVRKPAAGSRNIAGRDTGGRNVLVGIIDVGGFDFAHEDFLDADGRTRWVSIWDQGGKVRDHPPRFDYGSEILKEHMDAALASAPGSGLPAWALEPQTQMQPASHGTHVASIAAGNRGFCRNAFLAGVLVSLPPADASDRRKSFYDSTRVAHAVTYLFDLAERIKQERKLAELPVSINISLGTNGGGHDASSGVSRWIDNELAIPGRSVCVAAGNSGQEAARSAEDIGFTMGRIHTSGRIEARGLNKDLEWVVVGNGLADVSENELEIWYSGADRFAVSITPPGMDTIGPVRPKEYIQNQRMSDGSMLSIYNELYHPANGANYIAIYLSPFLKENPVVGVRPGVWTVRLHGIEIRDGRYHGWIERDDPRPTGIVGPRDYWNFPSFFTVRSNVDNSSVSSLACGARVVSVANLDSASGRIAVTSSQGPTRDGRLKPDVAAPGTGIVAANGFAGQDDGDWVAMSGTSMASPHVAGVVGLMLAESPRLTAAQICGIIQRTSQPLPGRNYAWTDDGGYGVLDAELCVGEAKGLSNRVKLNP